MIALPRIDELTYARMKKQISETDAFSHGVLDVAYNFPKNMQPDQLTPAMTYWIIVFLRLGGCGKEDFMDWMSEGYEMVGKKIDSMGGLDAIRAEYSVKE